MGREYKLDIIVDDHGAVQTLKSVAAAEDEVTAAAKQADTAVDNLNQRHVVSYNIFNKTRTELQQNRTVLQDTTRDFETIRVSAGEAAEALGAIGRGGSVRQTLNDIAAGAGFTVLEIGLLESAGLALGAAWAGWGIGRAIADFAGLDDIIARNAATVLGWGNVSAEQAAAKADVLARATKNVGYEVTNFSEALAINQEALLRWRTAAQEIADNAARLEAPAKSAHAIMVWHLELEKVRAAGVLPSLTRDMESHAFSIGELEKRYRVLPGTLQAYQRELTATAAHERDFQKFAEDAQKRLNDHLKEAADRARAFHDAYIHAMIEGEKHTDALDKKASQLLTTMTHLREEALKAELAAQTQLNAQQGLDALGRPKPSNPLDQAQRSLDDLHAKAQPGVSQRAQEELIQQQYLRAISDGTTAIVGMTTAERTAAAQADTLSRSHAGATLAAGSLAQSFGQAAGVFMSSASSFYQATAQSSVQRTLAGGGFTEGEAAARAAGQFIAGVGVQKFDVGGPVTNDGPIFAHRDEFVVPKEGVLVKGGGGGGNIYIDAKGAVFEDDRAIDRLATKVQQKIGQRAGGRF